MVRMAIIITYIDKFPPPAFPSSQFAQPKNNLQRGANALKGLYLSSPGNTLGNLKI
jgi:hypothetical protein